MSAVRRILGSVWFRVAVTLTLVGIVAARIDWDLVENRILGGEPGWFAAAVGFVFAALVVGAIRWQGLLVPAGIHLTVRQLTRVYAVSAFSQSFLPTTVGGDVARTLLVVRRGPLLPRVASTVLMDRAGGLAGLFGITWIALALQPGPAAAGWVSTLAWATLIGTLVIAAAAAVILLRPRIFARLVPTRLRAAAGSIRQIADDLLRRPWTMAMLLVTSVVFQALIAAQTCALARCIGVDVPYSVAAASLTLVTIATLIPISIGGFGVREGSYIVLLGAVGINATDATLISLGTVFALLIASLPGAVLLAVYGMRPAMETA